MAEYQKATCPSCHQIYKLPSSKALEQPFHCKKCNKKVKLIPKNSNKKITHPIKYDYNADQWLEEQDNSLLKRILKYEMASQEQIQKGLALYYQYKMAKKPIRLGGVLVQQGIITQNELELFDTFQDMNKVTEMDRSFAALAVKNKLVSIDNIKIAFQKQADHFKKTKQIILIGDILTKLGMMTPAYRDAILSRQKRLDTKYEDTSFGAVAIKMGLATRDQIDDALAAQQKIFSMTNQLQLLGNILVDKNVLTTAQTRQILIHQKELKQQAELKTKERTKTISTKNKKTNKSDKASPGDIKEYVNISVSKDHLEAHILPIRNLPEDTTLDDILFVLSENNIKYGIVNHFQIRSYLKDLLLQQSPWLIAKGKKPVQPEESTIKYSFKYLLDDISHGSNEGIRSITSKNWPKAKKGDVLAERLPGVDGMPGISVYAEIIDVQTKQTVQLLNGTGTKLSSDDNQVLALNNGLITLYMNNKVCVFTEKIIDGDFDVTEKPFNFPGALTVNGTIKGNNTIKCKMIFAQNIEQTDIHVETDIIVSGNISNATIFSRGNIIAHDIQHSTIKSFGHVIIQNSIEKTQLISDGQVSILKDAVKETDICAYQGIYAHSVLSSPEKNSSLTIGKGSFIHDEIKKINTNLPPLKKNLQKLSNFINKIKTNIAQIEENQKKLTTYIQNCQQKEKDLNHKDINAEEKQKINDQINKKIAIATEKIKNTQQISQKNKEKYLQYNKSYQQHIKQVKHLNEELIILKDWLSNGQFQPQIIISGSINKGTRIFSPNNKMVIEKDLSHIYIKELNSQSHQSTLKIGNLSDPPN